MSEPARVRGQWVRAAVVFAMCATAASPRTILSQQQLDGEGLALDLLERLEYTRAGADAVTASMSLVQFESQYCLPPDPPSKAREEQFLKLREATVAEYRQRYNSLRTQLLQLISSDGGARRVVDQTFEGNPVDAQAWDPWRRAFTRAMNSISAKRRELKAIPEVRCRVPEPQQTAPDPAPPTGPGIELPEPKVRPVGIPSFQLPFCSESAKQAVIQRFRAVAFDFYLNYQDAREYYDATTEALGQGRGNASVLRSLLPGARQSLDLHTKRLDDFNKELDRVSAMRVIDCGLQQQVAPDPIPPLLFDPFVFPAVPGKFCTEDARNETVRQLEAARNTARRNSDKAAARVIELGDRMAKGDTSTATSAAFQEASNAAPEWLQQSRALDTEMQRAAAIPIVACANQERPATGEQHAFGSGIKVGYKLAATNFSSFTEVVGDRPGIIEYSADDSPFYHGPFVEFNMNRQFRIGGSAMFGTHRFGQRYPSGRLNGTVGGVFVDSRVSYVQPFRRVTILGGGGITWAFNVISDLEFVNGDIEDLPSKSASGFMSNLGVAIEVPILQRGGARFGADFITSFKRPNADEHRRMWFALFYDAF